MTAQEIDSGESVNFETYTPEDAKNALAKNVINRSARKGKIDQYTRDMKEGRWNFCPDPITFNEEGNLINGQHRLNAQVKSETTQRWVVVHKAPLNTQNTMDTQVPRSAGDALGFAGVEHAQLAGAVARLVNHVIKGTLAGARYTVSNEEILRTVLENPSIRRSVEIAALSKRGMTPIAPSVLGAAHWMIHQNNSGAEADSFLWRIIKLTGEEEGSPVLALSRRVNELKRNNVRVHARDLLSLVIKAWNYDVEGKSATKLSYYSKAGEYKIPVAAKRDAAFPDPDEQ